MGRASVKPAVPLADMTEKVWQQSVSDLFRSLGWRGYHTLRSKGSQPGYPDLTLAHPIQGRVLWLELKSETGAVSDKQRDWIRTLADAGAEVYVVRPRHYQALASILLRPVTPAYHEARGELLLELDPILQEAA